MVSYNFSSSNKTNIFTVWFFPKKFFFALQPAEPSSYIVNNVAKSIYLAVDISKIVRDSESIWKQYKNEDCFFLFADEYATWIDFISDALIDKYHLKIVDCFFFITFVKRAMVRIHVLYSLWDFNCALMTNIIQQIEWNMVKKIKSTVISGCLWNSVRFLESSLHSIVLILGIKSVIVYFIDLPFQLRIFEIFLQLNVLASQKWATILLNWGPSGIAI